jgi:2-phosphosulfolactate phosphatase
MAERPFIGGIASVALEADHAKSLIAAGFGRDVELCLALDRYDRAVRYHDRQLQLEPVTGAGD